MRYTNICNMDHKIRFSVRESAVRHVTTSVLCHIASVLDLFDLGRKSDVEVECTRESGIKGIGF